MSSDELAIRAANDGFYHAFSARDLPAMEAIWARDVPVACIHPGWDALRTREEVIDSWRRILSNDRSPRVSCAEVTVHAHGAMAFVVCHERVGGAELVATNVFIRQEGAWKLTHHQAAPFAEAWADRTKTPQSDPRELN